MLPRTGHASFLWVRFGVLAVTTAQASKTLGDFDLPWHLAIGRHVVEQRALPVTDPLAFTHRPIEYVEFISDVLLYSLVRLGGPLALQLFGALLVAAIAVVLLSASGEQRPGAVAGVAVALGAICNWILVRPATISFLLLALTVHAIDVHHRQPEARRSRLVLLGLVPIAALWANVHGFVVIGLAALASYAGYRVVCRAARDRLEALFPARDGRQWWVAVLAAAGSVTACGVNSAGYRLLLAPLRASADLGRIAEWQKPSVAFLAGAAPGVLAFAALAGIALVAGRRDDGRRTPNAHQLAMLALGFALAQSALRMIPVAIILVTPWVARRLASVIPATRLMRASAALLVFLVAPVSVVLNPTRIGVGFEPSHFPEGAVRFVQRTPLRGRVYNFLDFGGYLTWRLHPAHLVLIDGRTGWVHDPALTAQYHASLRRPEAFASLTADFGLEWALVRANPGEPLAGPLAMSLDWTMVYLDGMSAVYVRRGGVNDHLVPSGYRALRHVTAPAAALDAVLSGRVEPEALSHDARLATEQAPGDARAWFFEAAAAVATRDSPRWQRARDRLIALVPGHPLLAAFSNHAPE